MFMTSSNLMFTFILINSTILAVTSNSWFMAWMALEINLMMLIPLLINKIKFYSTNSAIKYFLVQAMASIMIMISFIMFYYLNYNIMSISNELMMISMLMKSGIPPFQFWLPQVLEMVNLIQSFIILSWQKIAPFLFLSYTNSMLMIVPLIMSASIGAIAGLNQNSLMKILAYSSMVHGSWMIAGIKTSEKTWFIYFLIYNMIMLAFFLFINIFKTKKISEISKTYMSSFTKMIFSMNLLSMGGLPPFLGFMSKMIILQKMLFMKMIMLSMSLIMSSLISLLYYIRVCFSIFLKTKNILHKKDYSKKNNLSNQIIIYKSFGSPNSYFSLKF